MTAKFALSVNEFVVQPYNAFNAKGGCIQRKLVSGHIIVRNQYPKVFINQPKL
jgi:hypothetical protein